MTRKGVWHLVDPNGSSYCGDFCRDLMAVRKYPSLAAVEAEAATTRDPQRPESGADVCGNCRELRKVRGHE